MPLSSRRLFVVALFSILALGTAGESDAQFDQRVINRPCTACGATDVYTADLDGDGDQDVLSASFRDHKIAWYEKNGNGTFSEQRVISTNATGARSVFAVDLTGDGNPDVISASQFGDKIAWYENSGDGTFSGEQVITTSADAALSVFASDLTGDGNQDLISVSIKDGILGWYENTGDATFSDRRVIFTTQPSRLAEQVVAADLTGDGSQDILTAFQKSEDNGAVIWFENREDGTFSDPRMISTQVGGFQSLIAADLNRDGEKDIIFGAFEKLAWYENEGDGTFSDQKVIAADQGGLFTDVFPRSVDAADLTGDGNLDIVTAARIGDFGGQIGEIRWYENRGGGDFSDYRKITTRVFKPQSVHTSDVDGDGATDVLSASFSDDKVAWYENTSSGFSPQNVINRLPDTNGPSSVFTSDLSGDGNSDVLVASRFDNKIAWYEYTGDKSFSSQHVISTEAVGARSVHAADLTGNGKKDVLSASWKDDKIAWYENTGSSFESQKVINVPDADGGTAPGDDGNADGAVSVFAADLTGNGRQDVLSASIFDDKIAWYKNAGDGTFSDQRVITADADRASSVHAADLDEDGDRDVLSASFNDDKIAWYENTGGGSFSDQKVISTRADGAKSVFAADLTGDGDLDVLSASRFDRKIAWYENNGDGTFSAQQVISMSAGQAQSVYAADLNADGRMDVLSASQADDKIAWYRNDGGGSFSTQRIISTQTDGPRSVYAEDLTGNGMPDVLSASRRDNKVAWFETTSSALPVELATFKAKAAKSSRVVLTWKTASETNNAGFEVQHQSPNTEGWQAAGFIESKAKGGTSQVSHSYRFATESLVAGQHRFRLRQLDLDGSAHPSNPVSLQIKMKRPIHLSVPAPNPATTQANLSFAVKKGSQATVTLYNTLGRRVEVLYRGTSGEGQNRSLRVNVDDLASGTYFVRLHSKGRSMTRRLTVVK